MGIEQLEQTIQTLVSDINKESFIYDLLLAYGQPKAAISRLRKGDYNKSQNKNEVIWRKKLLFREVVNRDLHAVIDEMRNNPDILKYHPRFIILTDFNTLLAVDTKTDDTLDIQILDLAKHFDFFLPWAGMEKVQYQSENPADIKAAERMGRLYDIILEDNEDLNQTSEGKHALNIFLSRLLFCFFAEDTGIFDDDQFTNGIASHTVNDGSDLQRYLENLFKVLNLEDSSDYPNFLQEFPYVNGGLFAEIFPIPILSRSARKIIIECGALDWSAINPDIFGSMMQAVVHHSERSNLGMHYTSVINIMKVIEPLFLNELNEGLDNAEGNEKKLIKLLDRLYHMRIFDPACGSGNFLIITYKELCKLEIEIFRQLQQLDNKWNTAKSGIRLSQFYGIELDDFAHETAMLSLWLTEHQMNLAFKEVFGEAKPTLPLKDGGNIVCGNATRLDWLKVCPITEGYEVLVMGNPPYAGFKMQSVEQKTDMTAVLGGTKNYKNLDYIACWFLLGTQYLSNSNSRLAFVSTNSICQGVQVAILWPSLFELGAEIVFAHSSFQWTNNAKNNAGVTCIILGLSKSKHGLKYLYLDSVRKEVKNINAYLIAGENIIVEKRKAPLSVFPRISDGSGALDGGNLVLNEKERKHLLNRYPDSISLIKRLMGSNEFINGVERWCLWIENKHLSLALEIPEIKEKIKNVRHCRENGGTRGKNCIGTPHRFAWINRPTKSQIIIPTVSSERRAYIPMGYLEVDTIVSNSASIVHDPEPYIFGVISSKMHMTWVRAVAGRLKNDYRYTSALCYNTFPFPDISEEQKVDLEGHVFNVLDEREKHSEKTLAQLYDPDKMPGGLQEAHHDMDIAVERCYRTKPFNSDEERLEYLFNLYEEMIEAEKGK